MDDRQKIEETLVKKEIEIQSLEGKLRAAKVYVKALRDILKMLDQDGNPEPETTLRAGSTVARARDVIMSRGRPVHIDDLLQALGRDNTREAKASLGSSLAAYVRREEIFTRPAPNTFGLIELGHLTRSKSVQEPPAGFGRPPSQEDTDEEIPDIPF